MIRLALSCALLDCPAAAQDIKDSDAPSVPSAVSPMPSSTKSAKPGPPPLPLASAPVDGSADKAAAHLYKRLLSHFRRKIYSGHTSDKFSEVAAAAGNTPVVRAFDMQGYSPMNPWFGWKPDDKDGTTQAAIDWFESTKHKGIVTFQWHWFSPSGGTIEKSTFEKGFTTFDIRQAVIPGTAENKAALRDIDAIAVQLKKLQAKGVPVLWRPLHEANGNYFWWAIHGPGPCLKLYDIMYDRLTNFHGLHNLLWVWSDPTPAWYPGNSKVDIVGVDLYPGKYVYDSQKAKYDELFNMTRGAKIIALTETGPIPDIDALIK